MKVREIAEVLAGYDEETVKGIVDAAEALRSANTALEGLEPKKKRGRRKGTRNAAPVEAEPEPVKAQKAAPKKAASKKTRKVEEDDEQF